jgi:MoaA/NifB/PqqE/SkfB family radical SAM enzyme
VADALKALSPVAKKARLVRSYLAGRPVHCTWQLTPRCESFCHFCEHRMESAPDDLDTAGCLEVVQRLGSAGSLLVSFTGADPFLRGDFPEIVGALARRHFPLLVTNGWLVTEQVAHELWDAGLEAATVTLEDADPDRHDAASGMTGSHARAVAALKTLAGARTRTSQKVNARTRLLDGDVSRLPELLTLTEGLGVKVIVEAGFPLPREGNGTTGLGVRLREIRARHRNLRTGGIALDRMEQALAEGVPGCVAGRSFFNVDHQGRLSKCLEHQGGKDRVGAVTREGMPELLPALRARHETNDCQSCWYASRAEIEGLYSVKGFLGGLAELVRS